MNASDDLDEFELQLKQEAEAELVPDKSSEKPDGAYKDKDGTEYEWDEERRAWFPKVDTDLIASYQMNYGVDQNNSSENNPSSSTNPIGTSLASQQYETTEDGKYVYTDAQTGIKYEWDTGSNQWAQQSPAAAAAQNGKGDSTAAQPSTSDPGSKQKRKADESGGWFDIDDSKNTNVYVSGLPEEKFTEQEFVDLMSKCGIIAMDDELDKKKVKLYRDAEDHLKGDGLCCYLKRESVDLALQLLDGTTVNGHQISVQLAKFQKKEGYQPPKKKKKKKKAKKNPQAKLLAWMPEKNRVTEMAMGAKRMRHEKVVILKHAFHPSEFEEDATLITDISDDLKAECSKYGEVKKVMIFDRHPQGVASVRFKEAEFADKCVAALNGRWFAKRQLVVETWDGQTDYKIQETDLEREERMKNWEKFLEN